MALETHPDLEFELWLADRLRMTVARLRREMSEAEFGWWSTYHGRRAQRQELASLQAQAATRRR